MRVHSYSVLEATTSRRLAGIGAILLVFACCVALNAQNTISTIAGGGSLAGPATGPQADIAGPTSVVVDHQGNLYVVSAAAEQVLKVDPSGTTISVFAGLGWSTEYPQKLDGKPATQGSFNGPTGLAIDNAGNIYVADTTNYLIRKINTQGIMTTLAGSGHLCPDPTLPCGDNVGPATGAKLSNPTAVATDAAGNVYIADTGDNRIRVVNTQGSDITLYGVLIKAGSIATVAGNGVECASSTSSCGDGGKAKAANLSGPNGVFVDHLGNLLIADTGDRKIRGVIPSGFIGTYVGTGNPCNPTVGCGDGGPAKNANISSPWQIYMDAAENLYISDPPENRIRFVSNKQVISSIAGNGSACSNGSTPFCGDGGLATAGRLNSPRGVFVDAAGNIFIGDSGDQRVRKVLASTQNLSTYAGGGLGNDGGAATSGILAANRDIAVDNAGNYYIADTGNNRIRKVSGGTITTVAGTGVTGYSGNNVGATAPNVTFNSPQGLSVDASGNIFVADTFNRVIRKISAAGVISLVAGKPNQTCVPTTDCGDGLAATSATFTQPTKVAVDSAGNLYIADQGASRVRKVDTSGNISTIAGRTDGTICDNPIYPACGDGGPATSASLNAPVGVTVDSLGQVYIADTLDNRIRRVDTSGNINGYAFSGVDSFGLDGVPALQSTYDAPFYVALDSRDNLFVSGSHVYYVVQRIDVSTNPIVNPVASVAGWSGNPKYYGYCSSGTGCDGGPAVGAYLNNFGVTVDSSNNLYISDGGNNRVRLVSMVPVAQISPPKLNFPATPIGVQSAAKTFTVLSNGSDDLIMGGASTTGPFNLGNAAPCPGNSVAPNTGCAYSVTFTPTGYGPETGTAVVNDNSYGSPSQTVTLTGSGPDFSLTASPSTLTIPRGSAQHSTLTLTPAGGFNKLVTITCNGAPAGTTCVPNPSQLTLDGVNSANSDLAVTVGSSTAPGTYNLNVKGTSLTTHIFVVKLTVQ